MDRLCGGVWTVISNDVQEGGGRVVLQRFGSREQEVLCGAEAITLRKRFWLIEKKTITVE